MGIIAWIVLGVVVGMIAEHLISGRESHGIVVTCLIGVVMTPQEEVPAWPVTG
jgi:uncharacterized membrane protein YeaQ/YmgE (transglycosylase-associated protein family)